MFRDWLELVSVADDTLPGGPLLEEMLSPGLTLDISADTSPEAFVMKPDAERVVNKPGTVVDVPRVVFDSLSVTPLRVLRWLKTPWLSTDDNLNPVGAARR